MELVSWAGMAGGIGPVLIGWGNGEGAQSSAFARSATRTGQLLFEPWIMFRKFRQSRIVQQTNVLTYVTFAFTFATPIFSLTIVLIAQMNNVRLCHIRCRRGCSELRKVRMDDLKEGFTKFLGPVPSPLCLRDEMIDVGKLSP
jgi:hypothetical protein